MIFILLRKIQPRELNSSVRWLWIENKKRASYDAMYSNAIDPRTLITSVLSILCHSHYHYYDCYIHKSREKTMLQLIGHQL